MNWRSQFADMRAEFDAYRLSTHLARVNLSINFVPALPGAPKERP